MGGNGRRPGFMFVASPEGGLAHYVAHLWEPVSPYVRPLFLTRSDSEPDELVRSQVDRIHPLLSPDDSASLEAAVRLAARSGVEFVNLHVGSRVKQAVPYFVELMERLGDLGARRILHLHNVGIYRTTDTDEQANAALIRVSDAVLVGSEPERETLRESVDLGCRPVRLMRHGPYHHMDRGRFDRASARRHLGLPAHAPVALFFGYLRREKRVGDLFRAFGQVRTRVPDAELLVQCSLRYGADERAWIQRVAHEAGARLSLGYAPLELLEAQFRAADVVVLPYATGAASGVLNLARAFRRPVLVGSGMSQSHLVHGRAGLSIPSGDHEALAEALATLLALSPAGRAELAAGWDGALENEEWNDALEALLASCRPDEPEASGRERPDPKGSAVA